MIVERTVGGHVLRAECAAGLESAAGDVLRTLDDLARTGTPLRLGLRVRFGWSLLTLRADPDGAWRICEPCFDAAEDDALGARLDTTLQVLRAQVDWLQRLGESGCDIRHDQVVAVSGDALTAPDIFALRGPSSSDADSGWSVARVPAHGQPIDMAHLEALPIGHLVTARPGLLPLLALPEGYLVRIEGDSPIEIEAPDGRTAWRADAGPSSARS